MTVPPHRAGDPTNPTATVERSVAMTWAARGAAVVVGLGAVAGFVIGLFAHPATAWAAAIELGVPSMVLGLLGGLVLGAVTGAVRRKRSSARG
ncbi:MAG: hypothetical protein U0W40_06445 [Acidimicrobiia bacterium]